MSRIEQIIEELQEYVESCKFQPLSNSKIVANRDELNEMIDDMRRCLPDEIKKYQRIVANRDAILQDAQDKAAETQKQAEKLVAQLVDDHEIMQRAYQEANKKIGEADGEASRMIADAKEQGNKIIADYSSRAEDILNKAKAEANEIKNDASRYTDNSLGMIQNLLSSSIDSLTANYDAVRSALQSNLDVAVQNRQNVRAMREASANQAVPEEPQKPVDVFEYPSEDPSELGYDRNATLEEAYASVYTGPDTEEITNYDM